MRKFLPLTPVFLFLLLAPCFSQDIDQPRDNIKDTNDPYIWDFGKVNHGEDLQHTFILKNESPKVLNIKQVSTSCGCTASKVKKKTLLPGESAEIEVTFKTKGYSGPVQQFIYVTTDGLDNPILRFIIKAEVVKQ